jgi:hypothetical protein
VTTFAETPEQWGPDLSGSAVLRVSVGGAHSLTIESEEPDRFMGHSRDAVSHHLKNHVPPVQVRPSAQNQIPSKYVNGMRAR